MTNEAVGNIYLSGGGDEHASYPLDRFFFERIPNGGALLYIPIALKGHRLFNGAENWFRGVMKLHLRHEDVVLETWNELNGKDFSNLKRFDAIYVGGGNTWNLMKDITESGFNKFLQKYIEEGGTYYGGSAGAIICGLRIDTGKDENTVNWQDTGGMNMLNGLSVACHVKQEKLGELEIMAKEKELRLLALAEDAGAIINGSTHTCVGEGVCREFA